MNDGVLLLVSFFPLDIVSTLLQLAHGSLTILMTLCLEVIVYVTCIKFRFATYLIVSILALSHVHLRIAILSGITRSICILHPLNLDIALRSIFTPPIPLIRMHTRILHNSPKLLRGYLSPEQLIPPARGMIQHRFDGAGGIIKV